MTFPLISCVVPVFNGERYIRDALSSILAQTYRSLEILVADDGSTDETAALVKGYGEQIQLLRQAHQGPAAARNLGVGAARGTFVAFLDADDLWHPEKLVRQMARFRERPNLEFCITRVENFWDQELREEQDRFRGHSRGGALPGYICSALLARRALFDLVGPFNPALRHADKTEWFLRAAERGAAMEMLPDVLAYHRMHQANLSRTGAAASLEEYLRIVKASLDRRRGPDVSAPRPYEFPAPVKHQRADAP